MDQPIMETETTDTALPETPAATADTPDLSVTAHVAQFGSRKVATPPPAAVSADTPPSDGDATGTPQKRRGKDLVARVGQLTGRAKTAEERLAAAEAEITRLRSTPAPLPSAAPVQPQPVVTPHAPADPNDPEPQPTDGKFAGDYGAYLRDAQKWEVREGFRQLAFHQQQAQQQQTTQQQDVARKEFWKTRIEKSRQVYDDFDQVAFQTEIPWSKESIPHALIEKDDNGLDLLYYLQSHPEERDSILQMPEHKQVQKLSLILQRFESTGASTPGTTGSGATPKVVYLPPRPPNPVRTEAQRASGTPPPMDGTLSVAEHAKQFGGPRYKR